MPILTPLNIPIHRQSQNVRKSTAMSSSTSSKVSRLHPSLPVRLNRRRIFPNESSNKPKVQQGHLHVSTCGCVSFETKSISIPSGGIAHIVNIPMEPSKATKSYVCVPQKDTKTYLNVNFFFFFLFLYDSLVDSIQIICRRRLKTIRNMPF